MRGAPDFGPWTGDEAGASPFPDLDDPQQRELLAELFGALGYDTARTGDVVIQCHADTEESA